MQEEQQQAQQSVRPVQGPWRQDISPGPGRSGSAFLHRSPSAGKNGPPLQSAIVKVALRSFKREGNRDLIDLQDCDNAIAFNSKWTVGCECLR